MNVWEGVYRRFAEVPAQGAGFDGGVWIERNRAQLAEALGRGRGPDEGGARPAYDESLLPILVGLSRVDRGAVRVLDYGGGPGLTYLRVVASLPDPAGLMYHVVEVPAVVELGRETFRDDARIRFHASLDDAPSSFDVAHFGSSIHYVDDWRGLLDRVARRRPRFLLFTDLPAGDIPTYVTAQRYYESSIPVRFFNLDEFRGAVEATGFRLASRSSFRARILGAEENPQENFPTDLRLGPSCNLLFVRSTP